jgi:hypothetical protein
VDDLNVRRLGHDQVDYRAIRTGHLIMRSMESRVWKESPYQDLNLDARLEKPISLPVRLQGDAMSVGAPQSIGNECDGRGLIPHLGVGGPGPCRWTTDARVGSEDASGRNQTYPELAQHEAASPDDPLHCYLVPITACFPDTSTGEEGMARKRVCRPRGSGQPSRTGLDSRRRISI